MPEDTSKLLGLIEELAIIAEDAAEVGGIYGVTIDTSREQPVHVHLSSLDGLKKHYPDKVKNETFDQDYNQESMIFFDNVKVFCLIPQIKLVEAAI